MKIEPYRAWIHMVSIGIAFAAMVYFLQYVRQPVLYYILFTLSIIGTLALIYYLVYKPIANSKYFNF